MPDHPQVEQLVVTNEGRTPFALLEGTLLDGGWQHRVLVHSVLFETGHSMGIPVRCVEQGHWRAGSGQVVHRRRAPLQVRGALRGLSHGGQSSRADQGEVWSRVATIGERYGTSATGSLVETTDRIDLPRRLPKPLLGQRGVLVGVGGHPALLEVFEHPRSFAEQWPGLLEGLLATTLHLPVTHTPTYRAHRFAGRLAGRMLDRTAPAGDGHLVEAQDDLVSASALVASGGRAIHLAALNVRHQVVLAA